MAQRNITSAIRQRIVGTDQRAIRELTAVGHKTGAAVANKHRAVVKDWSQGHKPTFSYRVIVNPKMVRVTVFPKGHGRQIYRYVDLGTKGPYVIAAKFKPYLKFQAGSTPRTLPGAKYNQGAGGGTGNWVSKKQVLHPGIAARKFSETFEKEALPDMRRDIHNALRRAVRRA